VEYLDDEGLPRVLDFLDAPYGLRKEHVRALAPMFSVTDSNDKDTGAVFRVMHPLHTLMSRVHNTANLPGYETPHALKQLRVSVDALRAFIERWLLAEGETRGALKLIKQLYRFSHQSSAALIVFQRHSIDIFSAAPSHREGLPKEYEERSYPQMRDWLRRRRERWSRPGAERPSSFERLPRRS